MSRNPNGHRRRLELLLALAVLALVVGIGFMARSSAAAAPPFGVGASAPAADTGDQPTKLGNGAITGVSFKNDTSPPLRDMPPQPLKGGIEREANRNPALLLPHKDELDTVIQNFMAPLAMPTPILNFDGIPYPGVACNCAPPDTNGEVGATQYLQMVNEGFQIFNKTTGASVLGPVGIQTVWQGFGGVCETSGAGDPVVLYDQMANRWLISQFAGTGIPTSECIAISTTSDATGTWHRYGFLLGTNFFDYPHLGVWPDAYYMAMNIFNSSGTAYLGPQPFAFNRTAMLAGSPATFHSPGITGGATEETYLPADLDGSTLPPAGAPNTFVEWPNGGVYKVFHYHVDFATPANSSFTQVGTLPVAGFTQLCATTRACVPEPNGARLDAIADRWMFRMAYRNYGTHESLVGNYTVSANAVAGIRWVEFRNVSNPGGATIHQESTYQPDTTLWRWMGSVAMDTNGNLALGFSTSGAGAADFPALRYAGRLATDPLNTLAQGEALLFQGPGSQTGTGNRWGDYSDMTIDPVDDCTFWFTSEYYPAGSTSFNWRTRIGNFKYPSCSQGTPTPTWTGTPPTSTQTPTRTVTPSLTTTPCAGPTLLTEGFNGTLGQFASDVATCVPGGCGWTAVPTPTEGTHSAFAPDLANITDQRLVTSAAVAVPAGGGARVTFWHRYAFETPAYDGGVLEYSTNAGTTWTDVGQANFLLGGYNGTIDTGFQNPLLGRPAWVGTTAGVWNQVIANIPNAGGTSMLLRFRLGTDNSVAATGWWIDAVTIASGSCLPTPTGTPPTATQTRTSTISPTSTVTPTVPAGLCLLEGFNGSLGRFTSVVATCVPGGCGWTPVPTPTEGTHSAFAPDVANISDQQLTLSAPALAIGTGAQLTFSHRHAFETPNYDGGVLEVSTNGGTTWTDAGTNITTGGYNGTIDTGFMNPLLGRPAWIGTTAGAWNQVVVNLTPYAGQNLLFRFRLGTDNSVAATGWWIDNVRVVCSTGPTNTGTPATNTSTPTASSPTATPSCTLGWTTGPVYPITVMDEACTTQGGVLYCFGGVSNNAVIATSHKFDGTAWTAIAPLPGAREKASAVSDGTYIYVLNGSDSTGVLQSTLYRYDPAANTYNTTLANAPTATWAHAGAYHGGKIYRIGGCTIGACTTFTQVVDVYTISSNTWATGATFPGNTGWLMATTIGNFVYAAGGSGTLASEMKVTTALRNAGYKPNPNQKVPNVPNVPDATLKAYRYDPAGNTWDDAAMADLPDTRWGSADAVVDGKWVLAGGVVGAAVGSNAVVWDPGTNAWTTAPGTMPAARYRSSGGALGNSMYTIGGSAGTGFIGTNDNQKYTGGCGTPLPTNTPTRTNTVTGPTNTPQPGSTNTNTATRTNTTQPGATNTNTPPPGSTNTNTPVAGSPTPTGTPCDAEPFSDVGELDYFYVPVIYMYCHGIISGYADFTFRPFNTTTRGQLTKIVVLGFGFELSKNNVPTFADVPTTDTFYVFIETAAEHNLVSGYACGSPGEPCDEDQRPYFRAYNLITRGQLAKVVVIAANWEIQDPPSQSFTDVLPKTAFYTFVETAYCHGIISGYACGGPGEPCDEQSRPYFRQFGAATRGQIAKIVHLAILDEVGCAP